MRQDEPLITSHCFSQLYNLFPSGEDHHAGHADEEAMFDHSRHVAEISSQAVHVGDFSEVAVEDVIVLVGYKRLVIRSSSQIDLRTQRRDLFRDKLLGELN